MECTCHPVRLGREVVSKDWQSDCPEHGLGSDWHEHGGKQYQAAYREYAIEMQRLATEARRTGKSQSHLIKPPPQYKDLH